ncbi:MAG TPA: hypothetical protein VF666_04610 [Pyrinomonadaceae bacterium]|jgi:hypothetical protein
MREPLVTHGAAESRQETPDDVHARELGMWLRALESFFNLRNHPFTEAERAAILARDFGAETQIVNTVLLRVSQLVGGLTRFEAASSLDDVQPLNEAVGASLFEGVAADELNAQDPSLVEMGEAVGDASVMCRALLEMRAVDFYSWASVGKILLRQIDASDAARKFTRAAQYRHSSTLHPSLVALTERLMPDALGVDMRAVFSALARLLERLHFIEALLRRDQPLKHTLPIFTLIYEETRALLDLIETRALHIEGMDGAIFDALDGTAYAVGMETRKAFEHELIGLSTLRHARSLYAKVESAHGLLRDCFQQSTVSLAQIFDPTLNGARLFKDFQNKLDQSLVLREDLWKLLQLVRRAEQERDRRPLAPLLEQLIAFRDGSLRYLMYKDWESYERFVEEVAAARGAVELGPVLHRFSAYLETLFGQINMRAVLADFPFDYPQP